MTSNLIRSISKRLPPRLASEIKLLRMRAQLTRDLIGTRPSISSNDPLIDYTLGLNKVLQSKDAVAEAVARLRALKLRPHPDEPKNWDAYTAWSFIMSHGSNDSTVLDAGSEYYGVLLRWLRRFGYSNLYGCDFVFNRPIVSHSIRFSYQDLQETTYPSAMFDFVSCLSVIEHGVNITRYLTEMYRLLKPGGYLITSTDYWCQPINTNGKFPYGAKLGEMKIFVPADIDNLIEEAQSIGFRLVAPSIELTCDEPVVRWDRTDTNFTFITFALQKPEN